MLRMRTSARSSFNFARDAVQQPLHREHRLRAAGAAHHRGRDPVGEHHAGLDAKGRHHIPSGESGGGDIGHDDAPRQERAVVVHHGAAQAAGFFLAHRPRPPPSSAGRVPAWRRRNARAGLPAISPGGRAPSPPPGSPPPPDRTAPWHQSRRQPAARPRGSIRDRARASRRACRARDAASGSRTTR